MILALAAAALGMAEPEWLARIPVAPPEIGASLLLKVMARERSNRADRIEDAFRMAAQAKMRWPEAAAVSPESMEARRVEASFEQLDALTLQARAVEEMLRVDPRRALVLALEMPVPAPGPLTCSAASLPALERYYHLALQMAVRGFPASQRAEGRHLDFLLRVVASSETLAQLAPAAQVTALYDGPEEERGALYAALAGALRGARISAREKEYVGQIRQAVARMEAREGAQAVSEALAALEEAMAQAEPCPDEAGFPLWESGEAAQLREAVALYRRRREAREKEYMDLLRRVEGWRGEKEAPAMAQFHRKALLYRELMEAAPTDAALSSLISSYVRFLAAAPARTESPAEWVVHFRRLLLAWAPLGRKSVDIAVAEIRASGDALMNLLVDAHADGYL
ncbi:MAG: hypothetical protein NZR01_01190 [Bryobacteraceae bacterium]|nr:hypothetical protein [Bryobacteraceae bacterium]